MNTVNKPPQKHMLGISARVQTAVDLVVKEHRGDAKYLSKTYNALVQQMTDYSKDNTPETQVQLEL